MAVSSQEFEQLKSQLRSKKEGVSSEQFEKLRAGLKEKKPLTSFEARARAGEKVLEFAGIRPFLRELERPFVSLGAAVTGRKEAVPTPFGEVKPLSQVKPGEALGGALSALTGGTFAGLGKGAAARAAAKLEKPITRWSKRLYTSALKPTGKLKEQADRLASVGIKERVWLHQGGVEKTARKIDDLEGQLGQAIDEAKDQGIKIKTAGMKDYLDEAKGFFKDQVNVKEANKAIKEIDEIGKGFTKKFGDEIPIEEAQKIKVKTGQRLRKYYDRLSSAEIEAEKQGVRFLKDEIVKNAPVTKDINKRLSDLYTFDQALGKFQGRVGNLNLLGFVPRAGAAIGGVKGALIGQLTQLIESPAFKSGTAIGLDRLTKGGGEVIQKGRVPITVLVNNLVNALKEED